jgi:hypothetical protein
MGEDREDASQGDKVERLLKELKDLPEQGGVRVRGPLKDRPTLLKLAASIRRRRPGDDVDQAIDAKGVLEEVASKLPEDQAKVFKMMFAIGEFARFSNIGDRRSALAGELGYVPKTMYRREPAVLEAAASKIVEWEQEVRSSESAGSAQPAKPSSRDGISVDAIEVTLGVDEEGILVGRDATFTISAHDVHLVGAVAVIGELGNERIEIGQTVGCLDLEGPVLRMVASGYHEKPDFIERVEALRSLTENSSEPLPDREGLRAILASGGKVTAWAQTLQRRLQSMKQEQDVHFLVLWPPELDAGQSCTFSYSASYRKLTQADYINVVAVPAGASICAFARHSSSIGGTHGGSFSVIALRPVAQITMRLRAARPLNVSPTIKETSDSFSSPVTPLGWANPMEPKSDGHYEHTFSDVAQRESVGLRWHERGLEPQ